MSDHVYNSSVLKIKENGQIVEIVKNNFLTIDCGDLFAYAIGDNETKFLLDYQRMLFKFDDVHYKYINSKYGMLFFSGYTRGGIGFVSIVQMFEDSLVEELSKINSESMNLIRALQKKLSYRAYEYDSKVYDEISRLNNELVNTQRDIAKMYAELQDKNKLLNQLAIHDSLTGLYNRAYLKTKFDELIVHAKRLDSAMVMVMIDLNNFKQVNDTYGHEEGDLLLQKFAEVCQQMTRQDFDYIFRLGGDEFLILLTHSDVLMADKICMRINDEFMKHTLIASVAYGIVPILLNKSQELAYYLSEADVKMYEYKALFKSENIIGEKN